MHLNQLKIFPSALLKVDMVLNGFSDHQIFYSLMGFHSYLFKVFIIDSLPSKPDWAMTGVTMGWIKTAPVDISKEENVPGSTCSVCSDVIHIQKHEHNLQFCNNTLES